MQHTTSPAPGESFPLLEGLNPAQLNAVRHHGAPLLILAGAGSGKTRVITYKIAYLLQELGYHPREILAVTFTNKAAREMKDRAAGLSPAASDVMIRTFHSFGAWLLRRFAAEAGLSGSFTIYDDDDMVSLLRAIYPEEQRNSLKRVARTISRAKDLCLSPQDDLSQLVYDPRFGAMYAAYARRLSEIGNVDFGDLILRPIHLLQGPVGELMRSRFRAVLVDEYQDSNRAQYQLLKALVGTNSYICVVGDDDQSIYRFRGAEVGNILSFPESFPGADIHRLEQNYRSTAQILAVADAVVANNSGRLGKTLFTERTDGHRPRLIMLADHEAEAEYCRQLIAQSPSAGAGTAILYRTNAQSRVFETSFARAGIPYRIVGSLRFYEREEIKDAIAYLKLFANPADEVAFRRIINKPSRGIGAVSVERIFAAGTAEEGGRLHLVAATEAAAAGLSKKARTAARGFCKDYTELSERLHAGQSGGGQSGGGQSGGGLLNEFVVQVFERFGLVEYHVEQDEASGSGKRENLEEFVSASSMYPCSPEGLVEMLENLELDAGRESEDNATQRNAVTLITMHNTKGLEFDRVIITGLEDGLFPRSDDDQEELEEERRLFYVAATRAKDELMFTSCRARLVNGRLMELYPSRFLQEIPEDLLDVQALDFTRGGVGRGRARADSYRATGAGRRRTPEPRFATGSVVYHDEYGAGMVIKVWWSGAQEMLLVRFETGRELQFVAEYSGLERISADSF